jgi:predicted nucleotidyltransferase
MEQADLLRKIAETFDKLAIRYVVVGSTASIIYGESRNTNDIDVVIDLTAEKIDVFCAEFPQSEYYLSRPAVESAVRKRFQFNIIHPASGFKVDCFVAGSGEFDQAQLKRAVRLPRPDDGYEVAFASPEDVIIKKLEYFRLGESEKHVRDILAMLKISGDQIDRQYVADWAKRLNLHAIWDDILVRLKAG